MLTRSARKRVSQGMPEWLDGSVTELVEEPSSALFAALNDVLETRLPEFIQEGPGSGFYQDPVFSGDVRGVTKAHVGLDKVDNTADTDKPVSRATQTELAKKASTSELSSLATGTATALGGKADKDRLPVNVKDFGAKGDGVTDDTTALQAFFTYLADNGGQGYVKGTFKHTLPIVLRNPKNGFSLLTAGKKGTVFLFRARGPATGFSFVAPHDIEWGPCTIDGGLAETGFGGHGVSFSNPDNVYMEQVHVQNYLGSSIIFHSVDAEAGLFGRSTLVDCTCDGRGVANNGFLFANMVDSYMVRPVCKGLGRTAEFSPSYGAQLKNTCINSHIIDASVDGAKGGLVLASDNPDGGPLQSSITGVTRNCNTHLVLGKTKDSVMRGIVDMRKDPLASRAVDIGANSDGNTVSLKLIGAGADSLPAIRIGYHNNVVEVESASDIGAKLVEFRTSVQNNRLLVKHVWGGSINLSSLIEDLSGNGSNNVSFLPALGGLISATDAGASYLRFQSPTNSGTWFAYNHAVGQLNFRSKGTDVLGVNGTSIHPGVDQAQSAGTASRRFTTVFSQTGSINTSDARVKQDWTTDLAPELRAWAKVEFGKYRLKASVTEKGDGARWHFGALAQQVKEAFESEGLDPFEYGILCWDEWPATEEEPVGEQYGIRYEEALVLESLYLRSLVEKRDAA